jgi:hypothetical protein
MTAPRTLIAIATAALCALTGAMACPPRPAPPEEHPMSPSPASPLAYRVLVDGRLVQGAPPAELHVEGTLEHGRFVAQGDVRGDGAVGGGGHDGHPGHLQLASGKFVPAETAAAPVPPYVEGVMTTAGFVPGSRVVVYGP